MRRLSLTARLSLMFMLAVTAVLAAAGFAFNHLSQRHFELLDRHTLEDKLDASERILSRLDHSENFDRVRPELQALLGGHRDLSVLIVDEGGRVLFSDSSDTGLIEPFARFSRQNTWEWQGEGRFWRGVTRQLSLAERQAPLTVMLMLDVTTHMSFFHTLTRWLWVGLIVCALFSALLGWLLARSGLRPLRDFAQVAASISAKSLRERIPSEPIPAELQQLVMAFNGMLARLEDAFIRLSNFSADIAHELRTPVSNLRTHTEVVLTRARSIEDYQENLYSNLEELTRMSRMIDDMLFLAKADNGLIIPERKTIVLEDLIAKLLDYYQLLADEGDIRFECSGTGPIQGDELMLYRAISNLLSNALRYAPAGSVIKVEVSHSASTTAMSVENSGGTIAAEHLERLFDRFYRVDPARREGSPSNAGLGLAITRTIVEAHQGRIWCTSQDGWTVFHLEFPSVCA
ncbi:heavy metal sensor histidine kinase [Azotobacter vinelandii]